MIAQNPVAGARFFKYMVQLFIKHVLGVGVSHPGVYGNTAGYYGTVEQQGRLTLHLHMMLWIKNAPSPQDVRNKILDPNSDFQKHIVEYLEGVHMGEFFNGPMEHIRLKVESKENESSSPTLTLPEHAPTQCKIHSNDDDCQQCIVNNKWWSKFKDTVDHIVFRSNRHRCHTGCIHPKYGTCKARFPRDTYMETTVDPQTGYLNMKKGEAWLNTFTPVLSYLIRCNSDVTSLLSGTAIKAVVAYVADYITKTPLKTHVMFDAIMSVFQKDNTANDLNSNHNKKGHKLLVQIVNSLSANMEMGGPMASLYLLGHDDHYTSHVFRPFYWLPYVNKIKSDWQYTDIDHENIEEKWMVYVIENDIVGLSPVLDYIYHPVECKNICLYDWIRTAVKKKRNNKRSSVEYNDDINDYENDNTIDMSAEFKNDHIRRGKCQKLQNQRYVKDYVYNSSSDDDYPIQVDNDEDYASQHINEHYKTTSNDLKGGLFLNIHPQYKTHHITLLNEGKSSVPNFIGATLPRKDKGNREEYCLTMLCFFKPWRTGKELKNTDDSWEDAFLQYSFDDHQLQLMNNFQIKYECNDARDDFSVQQ